MFIQQNFMNISVLPLDKKLWCFNGLFLCNSDYKFFLQAAETLDNLLDDLDGLHQIVSTADPIPSSLDKLKNEIDENNASLF